MTAEPTRSRIRLAAALAVLVVVIGAGVFATSIFGTATTPSQTFTTTTTQSCSPTNDLAPPRHFAFNIAVNYTGKWGATVTGYSGVATPAFIDCYTGSGAGFIYMSDWNQGGQATLYVVAEKADSGGGNLSISVTFGSSNSTTQTNSTSLPHGSATLAATMVGEAAILPVVVVTTSVHGEGQLYEVTFRQSGACSPPAYVAPWSVTLGNETLVEPSNATLPIPGGSFVAGPQNEGLSTIVFSVPNGVYEYILSPSGAFAQLVGRVTVDGSDVSVTVIGPVLSCTTTR